MPIKPPKPFSERVSAAKARQKSFTISPQEDEEDLRLKQIIADEDAQKAAMPSPSSSGVWGRIKRTASDLASETSEDWRNRGTLASGFMEGAKEGARTEVPKLVKKVGSNLLGMGEMLITPPAKQAQDFGTQLALGNMGPKEAIGSVTGVNPGGSPGEIGGDLITALLLHKAMGGRATEPTPKPRIVPGEASTLIPNRRALPPVSSPTIIPSSADAFHAGPPGTGVEAFGGPKLGTVEGFAPQPVSAGMGRTPAAQMSPATRAFEALVPERYKADVTPRNLTTVGPPEPVNPYLSIVTDKGIERGIKARGIRLAQEKAAAPPPDVPVKAAPKKASAPPKVKTATASEALAGAQKGEVRMFEKSPDDTLQALAQRGNKHAIRELELRGGVVKKPVGKGPLARLKGETGAVGKNIEQVQIGKAGEVPTRPSSGDPGWTQTKKEMADYQTRQFFDAAVKRDPDLYGRSIDYEMKKNPNLTPDQAHENIFNRYRETQAENARLTGKPIEVDQWGKVNPEWEKPPFRGVKDLPEVTDEQMQRYTTEGGHTYEQTKMLPSKNWYAGQEGIDRAQVERVKKFGLNDVTDAENQQPFVRIDENGNYQVLEGHHRMTAALEQGKPLDMSVEDFQPMDSWMRKTRGMKGEQSPFAVKGKQAASAFQKAIEVEGEPKAGGKTIGSEFRRLLEDETGAVQLPTKAQLKAGAGKVYKGGKTALKAANELRIEAMLSGWALPKSLAGNIGAHGTAAVENLASGKGLKAAAAPIKEFFNVRENLKNVAKGYKNNPNPAGLPTHDVLPKWMRPFSATMGAFDAAATESLMRSGKTLQEARRLLLTEPRHDITKIRGNPVIDYLAPFKRTPGNQFFGGAETMAKHPGLAIGAAAGGALAGTQTDDPRALALISSLGGPYALPILAGAAATAGPRALAGISPIPEWSIQKSLGDPLNPFQRPAITRMFATPGEREPKSASEKAYDKRERKAKERGKPKKR